MYRRGNRTPKRYRSHDFSDDQRRSEKRRQGSSYGGNRRRRSPPYETRTPRYPDRRPYGHDDRTERKYSPPPSILFPPPALMPPPLTHSVPQHSSIHARLGPKLPQTPSPEEAHRHRSPSYQPSRRVRVRDRSASRSQQADVKEERSETSRRRESPCERIEAEERISIEELRSKWIESCGTVAKSDEELQTLINNSKENAADLRLFDKKSEERKKLQKLHKRLKKEVKEAYKVHAWQPTTPIEICSSLQQSSYKPSFVIDTIFSDVNDTEEFFGKFGTLSSCQTVDKNSNKVRIEFYKKEDAISALNHPKHPQGVSFFADPFPEIDARTMIKPGPDLSISVKAERSLPRSVSREREVKLENVDKALKRMGSLKKETSRRKKPLLKTPLKLKVDSDDFQANNDDLFTIIIDNSSHHFKTEEEVFDYFIKFGTLSSMHYLDGKGLDINLDPNNKIVANFEAGHSLLLAVNTEHEADIKVTVAEDCMTRRRRRISGDSKCSPHESQRKKRLAFKSSKRSNNPVVKKSRSRSPLSSFEENSSDNYQIKTPEKPPRRKNAKLPHRHSDCDSWECPKCRKRNKPRDKLVCYHCKTMRPGNWLCAKCDNINYPELLRCNMRKCAEIRKGNWICPDPDCQVLNWQHSIQCHREACRESQPGSWLCRGCDVFNWRDNHQCFLCKDSSSNPAQTKINFEFNAEEEKRRQAFERVKQQSQTENHSSESSAYKQLNFESHRKSRRNDLEGDSGTDWHHVFKELEAEQKRKNAEEAEKAKVVQNRLLALVGQSSSAPDPSPGPSSLRQVPFCVNIDTTDDEDEPSQQQPQSRSLLSGNPNLMPIGIPRRKQKSKIEMRKEVVGLMDDEIMDQLNNASEQEQDKILSQFNIVRVEPPKRKVVEIDLFDSDDDEEDEAGQDVLTDAAKTNDVDGIKNKTEEEIVADIVRKDLDSLGGKQSSAFNEMETNNDDDSDIVIIEDD